MDAKSNAVYVAGWTEGYEHAQSNHQMSSLDGVDVEWARGYLAGLDAGRGFYAAGTPQGSTLVSLVWRRRASLPTVQQLQAWSNDGVAEATDGCPIEPDGTCSHGARSWLLELGLI